MDRTARAIRDEVSGLRQEAEGGRTRYPAELRERVCGYATAKRREGVSVPELARRRGMPFPTLAQWLRERAPEPGFRRVGVEPAEARNGGPVLITRSGHRLEGLPLSDLVAVLRALS